MTVAFTNDAATATCDRNLRVDRATFSNSSGSTSPLAGASLYVDPNSNAKQQADTWRASRPADAAQMDKIAGQLEAAWFGAWSGDIFTAVNARVAAAAAKSAVPVLVAYNVPLRDCSGGYSAGGVDSPDAYRSWIRSFADGIGSLRAVVVPEPDPVADLSCLSPTDAATRLSLITEAWPA